MPNLTHETDFIRYFGQIAFNVDMPEDDFLAVMDAFFKTIIVNGCSRLRIGDDPR